MMSLFNFFRIREDILSVNFLHQFKLLATSPFFLKMLVTPVTNSSTFVSKTLVALSSDPASLFLSILNFFWPTFIYSGCDLAVCG